MKSPHIWRARYAHLPDLLAFLAVYAEAMATYNVSNRKQPGTGCASSEKHVRAVASAFPCSPCSRSPLAWWDRLSCTLSA
jgi:hypothetical protein